MSSEIIESVAFDNYDGDFQHVDFMLSQNFISLPILRIYHETDHRARYFWNFNVEYNFCYDYFKNMFWNILGRQNNSSC